VKSGDVLFHNILLLHGSPANTSSKLRRVIYYEFRPSQTELELGPHVTEYIPLKRRVLHACLEKRAKVDYLTHEEPYCYVPSIADGEEGDGQRNPTTFRYPHEHFWRL
jgi:phytanoyl-CoA hydroxylase